MATKYHFISSYTLTSQPEAVWAALIDVERWPRWWRWLKRLDVVRSPTGPDSLGLICTNYVRARTGYGFTYTTEITDVDRGRRIDIISGGELVGRGRLLMAPSEGGGTDLMFAWLVETPRWWMNLLAPIARPAFNWNHDGMMTDFGTGLASSSGGQVVSSANRAIAPREPGFQILPETI